MFIVTYALNENATKLADLVAFSFKAEQNPHHLSDFKNSSRRIR